MLKLCKNCFFAGAAGLEGRMSIRGLAIFSGIWLLVCPAFAQISVVEPEAGLSRITQGQDFATWGIGNAWDMNEPADIVLTESKDLAEETFSEGVYSFRTLSNDNRFWLVYFGLPNAFRGLEIGERHPISTSTYRYLSVKVRMRDAQGQPLTSDQPFVARFFRDSNWQSTNEFGITRGRRETFEDWTVIEWDLADPGQLRPASNIQWTDFSEVRGLRINPTNNPDVRVEIDWVRLSAGPSASTSGTVAWEDDAGSGPYDVFVTDGDFVLTLASNLPGDSAEVDLTALPPGDYMAGVTDGSEIALSPGSFTVNDAPVLHLTTPDRKGDQARGYGIEQAGNGWNSIDAGDISTTPDLTDVRFDDPPGSLSARPTSSDPRILFDTPLAIDTSVYRMLCYVFEVRGQRDIGLGSVARILWGNNLPTLATSDDIVVNDGLNEYCVGDLADMPTEDPADDWSGMVNFIRFDPHEFPVSSECSATPTPENCRDIRLDSFILAPFHRAEGGITLEWDSTDADDDALISLYYDDDLTPFNGNENIIVENLAQSDASGGSFFWNTTTVPEGVYNILSVITDGRNTTERYGSGPVEVVPGDVVVEFIFSDGFEP